MGAIVDVVFGVPKEGVAVPKGAVLVVVEVPNAGAPNDGVDVPNEKPDGALVVAAGAKPVPVVPKPVLCCGVPKPVFCCGVPIPAPCCGVPKPTFC